MARCLPAADLDIPHDVGAVTALRRPPFRPALGLVLFLTELDRDRCDHLVEHDREFIAPRGLCQRGIDIADEAGQDIGVSPAIREHLPGDRLRTTCKDRLGQFCPTLSKSRPERRPSGGDNPAVVEPGAAPGRQPAAGRAAKPMHQPGEHGLGGAWPHEPVRMHRIENAAMRQRQRQTIVEPRAILDNRHARFQGRQRLAAREARPGFEAAHERSTVSGRSPRPSTQR